MNQQYLINDGSEIKLPELSKEDLWDNGFYGCSQFEFVPSSDQDFSCLEDEPKTYIDLQPIEKDIIKSADLHQFTNDKLKQTLLKRQSEKTAKKTQAPPAQSLPPFSQPHAVHEPPAAVKLECSEISQSFNCTAAPVTRNVSLENAEVFRSSYSPLKSSVSYQQPVDNANIHSHHHPSEISHAHNNANLPFINEQTLPLPKTSSPSINANTRVATDRPPVRPPENEILPDDDSFRSAPNAVRSKFDSASPENFVNQQCENSTNKLQNMLPLESLQYQPASDVMTAQYSVMQQSQSKQSEHEDLVPQKLTDFGSNNTQCLPDENSLAPQYKNVKAENCPTPPHEVMNSANSFQQVQKTSISQVDPNLHAQPQIQSPEKAFLDETQTAIGLAKNISTTKNVYSESYSNSSSSPLHPSPNAKPNQPKITPPMGTNISVQQFQQSKSLTSLNNMWNVNNSNTNASQWNVDNSNTNAGQQPQYGGAIAFQTQMPEPTAYSRQHSAQSLHQEPLLLPTKTAPNAENTPPHDETDKMPVVSPSTSDLLCSKPADEFKNFVYQSPPPRKVSQENPPLENQGQKCTKAAGRNNLPLLNFQFASSLPDSLSNSNSTPHLNQEKSVVKNLSHESNSLRCNATTAQRSSPHNAASMPQQNNLSTVPKALFQTCTPKDNEYRKASQIMSMPDISIQNQSPLPNVYHFSRGTMPLGVHHPINHEKSNVENMLRNPSPSETINSQATTTTSPSPFITKSCPTSQPYSHHQPYPKCITESLSQHTLQYSSAVSTSSFTCSQSYTTPVSSVSVVSEMKPKTDTSQFPKIHASTYNASPALGQFPVQNTPQSIQPSQPLPDCIASPNVELRKAPKHGTADGGSSHNLDNIHQNPPSSSSSNQHSLLTTLSSFGEHQSPPNSSKPHSVSGSTTSKPSSLGNKICDSKIFYPSLFGECPQSASKVPFQIPRHTVINDSIYSTFCSKSASPTTTFSNESKLNKKDVPNVNVSNHEWLERLEKLRTNAKVDVPQCDCPSKDENDRNPYYTHLGAGPTVSAIRETMEKRFGVTGAAVRIEKLIYTGKEGKTSQGCPLAKWIIRRAGPEEKYLILAKHRTGHRCATAWIVIGIVAWEGVPSPSADDLYNVLVYKLTKFGLPTQRRCGINEQRTCACQGMDQYSGASFSFGCSWSMYYNGCKYARSKNIHKFKLSESSEEPEVEEKLQNLATNLAPVYKQIAPDSYNNQVEFEKAGSECRLGRTTGRPWSGVTACVDFCAHAHKDLHNMNNGCTVVVTLTKHRGFEKPDDEQLHVLPLYVIDSTDEHGSKEAQQKKVQTGSLEMLDSYPLEMRIRNNPLTPCRKRGKKKKEDGSTTPKDKDTSMSPKFSNASPGRESLSKSPRLNGKACNAATKRKEMNSKRLLFPQQSYNLLSPMNPQCYQQNMNANPMGHPPPRLCPDVTNPFAESVAKSPMKFPSARYGAVAPYHLNPAKPNGTLNSQPLPPMKQFKNIPNGNLTSLQILSEVVAIAHEQMMAGNTVNTDQQHNGHLGRQTPLQTPAMQPPQIPQEQMMACNTVNTDQQHNGHLGRQTPLQTPAMQPPQIPQEQHNMHAMNCGQKNWENNVTQNFFQNSNMEHCAPNGMNFKALNTCITPGDRPMLTNYGQMAPPPHHNAAPLPPPGNKGLFMEQHAPLQIVNKMREKIAMLSNPAMARNDGNQAIVYNRGPAKMGPMSGESLQLPSYNGKRTAVASSGLNMQQYLPFYGNDKMLNQFLSPNLGFKEEKFEPEMDFYSPPPSPLREEKDPNGFFELHSDNEECFVDNTIGGVAIALSHGSVLFECAKHELHATTALKRPSRLQPTRISLVFYQHKNMNLRSHGWSEFERKMELKRLDENYHQDGPPPCKKPKQESPAPPCVKTISIPTRQITTGSTTSWITVFPFSPLIVTGPYQKWI